MTDRLQTENKATSSRSFSASLTGLLQRKCACGTHTMAGGECAGCAKKKSELQRKLAIGVSHDPLEQEADRIAAQVLATSASSPVSGALPHIQRFAGQPTRQRAEAPASVEQTLAGSGRPLDSALQHEMGQRFGHDFSQVRVHTGAAAEQSAQDVNAHAYTVGNNVVFGQGQFTPGTHEGQRLLAHELTHVVQQWKGSNNVLQRLIRSPYPWRGVIVPAIGANIRSAPDSSDPANILDSIPRGETVRVLSASGNWLRVESRYRGSALVGYIYHTLVDDASSSSMAASVGTQMIWRPSGPGSGTSFESWASAATETAFPPVTAATVMNCWEAVLLSAYRAGAINWNWIHNLYVTTPTANWVAAMTRGARRGYAVPGPNMTMPQRGDLVFFDGLAHVALATGNGSEVFTFWPPPNTPFLPGGTLDRVKVFTIEDLVAWWGVHLPPQPSVEFAAPAW